MGTEKNAWDLLKRIGDYDRRSSIETRLHQQGGWRTFFDEMSHQWDMTTMGAKIDFLIEIIEATGSSFLEIVDLYRKDYGADRPDISARTGEALMTLLDHMLKKEAGKV